MLFRSLGNSGIGDGDFVVPPGVNRVLVATVIDINDGVNVDSVKLGGVDATLVASSSTSGVRTSVYLLALGSATQESSGFFEVNWTANTNGMYLTQLFHNVDQANPVGAMLTTTLTSASVMLGSSDLALSIIGASNAAAPLVAGSNQTQINSETFGSTEGIVSVKTDDGGSNSFTYEDLGGGVSYAHVALSLQYSGNVNPSAPRISSIQIGRAHV